MHLTEKEIISIVSKELPGIHIKDSLQPLEGGNLNHVWRLEGMEKNFIVKVAPPYIAANPEIPLSPDRIQFEANALQLFQPENLLNPLASDKIRPPHIEFYDSEHRLLVMEDVGDCSHFGEANLTEAQYLELGQTLGNFIARLHTHTEGNTDLAAQFNNIDIQKTRLHVQYQSAAKYAQKGGVKDVKSIQNRTEELGKKLLLPGKCLIMGDLWPPSILLDSERVRLIDWEFAHFGRPLQDVGHFAAHCWMLAHTTSQNKKREALKKIWEQFWKAYQNEMGNAFHIFDDQEFSDMTTHIGAEILVRATGSFKEGYVYAAYHTGHPLIKEAVAKSEQLIFSEHPSTLWT